MEGAERKDAKRRSLEAGREMLARYKALHGKAETNQADSSDVDEVLLHHNETAESSVDLQSTSMLEDTSCRDTTQSSMSVSEGEGDGDIEGMAGRVAELKELLQGKEAVIESLSAEIDHMRAEACSPNSSQSHNSSTQYKDILHVYQTKLQDFESAISQRDQLIQELSSGLEQALQARDTLKTQLQAINAMPILTASSPAPQQPQDVQKQISQLQQSLQYNIELVKTLENEKQKQNETISGYKLQISYLDEKIRVREAQINLNIEETQKTQVEYEAQVEKITKDMQVIFEKFKNETELKAAKHQQEVDELKEKHQTEISQIKHEHEEKYRLICERFNKELPELETKHTKDLSALQTQLTSYKKTIEVLKTELDNQSEKSEVNSLKSLLLNYQQEKEMLNEQIQLHKSQVEDLTAKYIAAASVFDSKESIERSLEEALTNVACLKQENETLKFKYDDLSARYSAAQALIENNQVHERSLSNKVYDLEKSLSRLSGITNASYMSEFNATTYQNFDELAIQVQMSKSKLAEKELIENKLIERIQILEDSVTKANKQLEEANMEKRSYEKQLKDMKNSCDKIMSDIQNSTNPTNGVNTNENESKSLGTVSNQNSLGNEVYDRLDSCLQEIDELRQTIKRKDSEISEKNFRLQDALEKMNLYQAKCEQLKSGLAKAWEQCAQQTEKLNQSLALNQSRLGASFATTTLESTFNNNDLIDGSEDTESPYTDSRSRLQPNDSNILADESDVPFSLDNTEIKTKLEKIEKENQRLLNENSILLKTRENLDLVKKSLDDVNKEKALLVKEIASLSEKHEHDIAKLKATYASELGELQSLLSGSGIEKFKDELDKKHAKEMEELRMYFEAKCLQMEKQYSEEIFSQQSKKMSDDSSENEEMTDDLFYGGGEGNGGCSDVTKGKQTNQHCQTEWDVAVENGELTELRAAYSLQLEEQVALARHDIVNALQEQIQKLLVVESDTEENWPPELLQLRNKFTSNAKRELEKLKEVHALEISQIKEEHSKSLTRTIERFQEEIKKLNELYQKKSEDEHVEINPELMTQKYENLYKTCVTLKGLIVDLVKYLVTCEEELNNTFIGEIIKRQALSETQTTSDLEQEPEETTDKQQTSDVSSTLPSTKIKRVHFAPQTHKISSIINSETDILLGLIDEEKDIAANLREELDKCLQRMKTESAQIVNISLQPGETMLDTLTKQVLWTTKVNEEISAKLQEAECLVEGYQEESKQLKMKIINLREKLNSIEENKEIISEGYGEQDHTANDIAEEDFSQLHEKARLAIISGAGDTTYLLQLIEELSRCNEKLIDDFRREKEDLQQQIDAADKQLRSTRKFLEEQATEREIERDDAARQIKSFQEKLKECERDKERDLRISSEVEALEFQMREMSSLVSDTEAKKSETESELKVAVDKIWVLRDIIVDLEQQVQAKNQREESLMAQVDQMKEVIIEQTQNQRELAEEIEAIKSGGDSQMNDHITHLQDELRKHKLSTEHFNVKSTALKQMKSELREMQNHLDKRIKELEALHMCGSNLSISQPSEDVSIRDQIDASRCLTPDDDPNAPPTLPLDQLLKLKEKLFKHSRTEEVAFKKIKDLDMQLSAFKMQNEELLAEQEILQQNNSEQLFQIEQMKGRLEQYKHSAPFAQRQATSKLELELHEINAKLQSMEQTVARKDLEINNLKIQLERVNQVLIERQQEFASAVQNENDVIQDLRNKLEMVEHEKRILEAKLEAQHDLPQLIDSILADKNEEIDHLKEKLSKKEKQLEAFTDDSNIKQHEPKNSARTLSDIVSINSECEEVCEAIRETSHFQSHFPHNMSSIRALNTFQNTLGKDSFESPAVTLVDLQKSEIQIPPLDLGNSPSPINTPDNTKQISMPGIDSEINLASPPSDSISPSDITDHGKSIENRPNFSKVKNLSPIVEKNQSSQSGSTKHCVEDLENQLKAIYEELKNKSSTLNKRELELNDLKKSLDELRIESKNSIENLTRDKHFYKNQFELSQETETKIQKDLLEVENHLKITTEKLEDYKEKIQTNEKILIEVQSENKILKETIGKLCDSNAQELRNLRELIFEKDITIETVQTRNVEIENENKQLYDFKTNFEICRKDLADCQNEIKRLNDGINSRDEVIKRLENMARRVSQSGLINSPSDENKDKEIYHLKEYLKEKENIIRQMSDDSKSLQRSLETIQNKMKESGNVVELRKKLYQERKYNSEFAKMIAKLTHELETLKGESSSWPVAEANDIEDMVKRELNLSADLDKSIIEVIESESVEMPMRNIEMHSCDSLNIKPVEQDLEKIMKQHLEIRNKLKKQIKLNQELHRQKDDLEIEREMLKSRVTEYENRIFQIKSEFENERKKNIELSDELVSKKTAIRNLVIQARKEKCELEKAQLQDSELINLLRIKCKSSLNEEEELRNRLTLMRQKYKTVTTQLTDLKSQIESNRVLQLPDSPQLPEAEHNDILLAEKYEKEHRENLELQETLKKLQVEKNRCEKDLEVAMEEHEKLLSTVAVTEDMKGHLEIDLRRTKEELKSRIDECEWHQKRIKTMIDAEEKRSQKRLDLENEVKNLRKELNNMRDVMNDAGEDANEIRRQLTLSLNEQEQLSHVISSLRKSEKDLKKQLNEATIEEEKLKGIIHDLQSKLSVSIKNDIDMMKEQQKNGKEKNISASQYKQNIFDLSNEIERYSQEKSVLHDKLMKAREENTQLGEKIRELEEFIRTKHIGNSDEVTKLQQVYGKYIRTDSKRKALAFQKRYLLCVIGGYQLSEETTLSVLAQLTNTQKSFMTSHDNKKTAKARFRCLVLVVISIQRMKWKVQRWRTGIRKAGTQIVQDKPDQLFLPIRRHRVDHSPPVKQKRSKENIIDYDHYLQRMLNIQNTLGLASGESTSRD